MFRLAVYFGDYNYDIAALQIYELYFDNVNRYSKNKKKV